MEFTFSRAALMACGVILMSIFAVPFGSLMESGHEPEIQELAERDAGIINRFWISDVDELRLDGDSLLPSDAYVLSVDGLLLTITDPEGKTFFASLKRDSGSFVLCRGETVILSK